MLEWYPPITVICEDLILVLDQACVGMHTGTYSILLHVTESSLWYQGILVLELVHPSKVWASCCPVDQLELNYQSMERA
eukprot:1342332-Amphidinium_carterae.1